MNLTSTGVTESALASVTVPLVIAFIIALVGAVSVALLFLNPKRKGRYKGLMQKLDAHLNFDRFLLSAILKFLYAFAALFCIVYGLIQLFAGSILLGLMWLVLVPLGLRVGFEQLLLLLSIRDEACETNDLLRRMQGLPPKNPPKPVEQPRPAAPQPVRAQQPDPRYAQRQNSYPAQGTGFSGYVAVPPQPQAQNRAVDYTRAPRYNPARSNGYESAGFDAANHTQSTPVVRPTPADGTGRFTALPMKDKLE